LLFDIEVAFSTDSGRAARFGSFALAERRSFFNRDAVRERLVYDLASREPSRGSKTRRPVLRVGVELNAHQP